MWRVKVKVKSLSCVRLFATPWTVAYQAPPSPGFSRQEYWSGVPFRDTANKYRWRVWGVLTVYGSHWVCPSSRQCVLPGSTVLRIQVALQGNCPKQALYFMHFPGSGSQVLHKGRLGWACVLCPSQAQTAQATRCLASALSQVGCASQSPPWSQPLGFPGAA